VIEARVGVDMPARARGAMSVKARWPISPHGLCKGGLRDPRSHCPLDYYQLPAETEASRRAEESALGSPLFSPLARFQHDRYADWRCMHGVGCRYADAHEGNEHYRTGRWRAEPIQEQEDR
jgi:hypothetical protein